MKEEQEEKQEARIAEKSSHPEFFLGQTLTAQGGRPPSWLIVLAENGFIVTSHVTRKQWIFDDLIQLRENLPEIIEDGRAKRK